VALSRHSIHWWCWAGACIGPGSKMQKMQHFNITFHESCTLFCIAMQAFETKNKDNNQPCVACSRHSLYWWQWGLHLCRMQTPKILDLNIFVFIRAAPFHVDYHPTNKSQKLKTATNCVCCHLGLSLHWCCWGLALAQEANAINEASQHFPMRVAPFECIAVQATKLQKFKTKTNQVWYCPGTCYISDVG